MVAPTGKGKTTLALALLGLRDYVLIMATKPRDPLLSAKNGYERIGSWPPHQWADRVILWPKLSRRQKRDGYELNAMACYEQTEALQHIYDNPSAAGGNWTVYIDEARFLSDICKQSRRLSLLWLQGRSLGITLVVSSQRPSHLPREAWSEATHLFTHKVRDHEDLKRVAEISGIVDRRTLGQHLSELTGYEFLYVHRDGDMWITTAPRPAGTTRPPPGGDDRDHRPDKPRKRLTRVFYG